MITIGTIREFNTDNFRVVVDAIEDYDIDLSFDDTGEVMQKLESGEYVGFTARVRVLHDKLGEVGSDYLGGCIYEDIESFEDHRKCGKYNRELRAKGSTSVCGSYFADMVKRAVHEARQAISEAQSIYVRS